MRREGIARLVVDVKEWPAWLRNRVEMIGKFQRVGDHNCLAFR